MNSGRCSLALVGDYSASVPAHRAIPLALERIAAENGRALAWRWLGTSEIRDAHALSDFSAVWLVPASPYRNMDGALIAARWAREMRRPFLGTCGGFQHALIEFARHVAGLVHADHAETSPDAEELLISPLACPLVEKVGSLHFATGSLVRDAYGTAAAREDYHCNFGLNPRYRSVLESAGLRFTAVDDTGDIRAAELSRDIHPFFVGTLFQPERAALHGVAPPLVRAFVQAIIAHENPPR